MAGQRDGDPPNGGLELAWWEFSKHKDAEGARLRYIRHVNGVGRPPHINRKRMGINDLYRDGGGDPSNPEFTKFWST